ncbi:MAG TPA: alpha/beta fold hydrolase, partial [Kofleriaceae bacterium]|nr:alpha/beta fold hydrolase [Kofleriaceae bacterium]
DDLGRRQRRRGLGQIALTERDLPAIAWTLQRGREAMIERAAIVSASLPGLIDQLRAVAAGEPAPGVTTGTATAVAARFLDGREGDAYLSILIADGKHDRLAALWASGASLPWRRLYGDRTPAIVSLPHYPFARQRCWLEAQPLATAAPARSAQAPAAPAATPAFAASPAAAPDELVDHLAVLVADALKLSPDELDRDADLRTYGLDSRLAARFMQTVQRRFGHGVALTAAYAHPTLNRLAAHLAPIAAHTTTAPTAAAAPSPSDQPRRIAIPADDARELVAINPSGTQPASFWVHGAAGTAQPFHALSAALGSDYPVFAFQARGLDGAAMPFTRVEDAAAHYVACLQRQQAAGPYLLGGLSSGGILAFEMARQLRDRGERVSRLVLLDTYPAVASTMQESGDYVDPSFQNLMMANAFLRFGEAAIRPEDVAGLSPAQQVPRLVELIKARSHTALGVDELYRLLSDTIAVYQALDAGLRQYEPTPIDGVDALFFHAEKGFFGDADVLGIPALDVFRDYDSIGPWRRWIHGALDVVPLACGHVEILEAPAIDQVVARLRTVLSPTPRARPARPQPVVRSNP